MQNVLYIEDLEKLEQLPRTNRKSLFFVEPQFLKDDSDKNKDMKNIIDLLKVEMLKVPTMLFPPLYIVLSSMTLPYMAKKIIDMKNNKDNNVIINQIEKLSKTIGSIVILPSDIKQKFKSVDITLQPDPQSIFYLINPFNDRIYHSIKTYNDDLMISKFYETIEFFSSLGSKKIEVELSTAEESMREALINASAKLNLSGLKNIKSLGSIGGGFSGKISTEKKNERQIVFKAEFDDIETKNNLSIKDRILSLFKTKSNKTQNYIDVSVKDRLIWFDYEPSWQHIYYNRINRNLKTVAYSFNFTNVSNLDIFLDLSLVFEFLKSCGVNLNLDFGYKSYNLKDVKFYFNVEFF